MKHIGFVYLVIDWEGDVSCAATTKAEAEEIVREAAEDGNLDYRIEEVYLFSEAESEPIQQNEK